MYEIVKTEENSRTVQFTEDAESIQKQFDVIRRQISKDLDMPGFRPGKVPRSIIDKQYGNMIKAEVAEHVRSNLTTELLETEDWILDDGDPQGKMDLPAEGKPYSFEMTFSLFETPQPKGIEGIKISLPTLDKDKAVEDTLNSFREKMVSFQKIDRPSEPGDLLLFETSPVQGDDPAREFSVRIGESQLGPGFDEIVTGLNEAAEFHARMDGGEGEDKPPLHHFRLIEVQEPLLPDLDDDFASKAAGLQTMEELREKVENSVLSRYEQEIIYLKERIVVDSLLENNEFDPPGYMVNNLTRDYIERLGEEAPSQETKDAAREMALRKVREFLILRQVALSGNIEVADSEIEEDMSSGDSKYSVLDRLRNRKAMEHIINLAAIIEEKPVSEEPAEVSQEDSSSWRWIRVDDNSEETSGAAAAGKDKS